MTDVWRLFIPRHALRYLAKQAVAHTKGYQMKAVNIFTLVLVIVSGINWGLVALFQYDLVLAFFSGHNSVLPQIVYVFMGLSALWQLYPLAKAIQSQKIPQPRYRS
jgi:uncharacterized protein